MARLYVLLFLLQIALAVLALISCLSAEEGEIRALPRLIWVLIILFFPLVGAIGWFLAGRPQPAGQPGLSGRAGGAPAPKGRPRPVAPDDDPDFLRSLGERQSAQDRKLFEQWEEDLRRREDDLRCQGDPLNDDAPERDDPRRDDPRREDERP